MNKTLTITHTVDRHGKPLCVVHDLPGLDAEFYPDQMRAYGYALLEAAMAAESRKDKRRFKCAYNCAPDAPKMGSLEPDPTPPGAA